MSENTNQDRCTYVVSLISTDPDNPDDHVSGFDVRTFFCDDLYDVQETLCNTLCEDISRDGGPLDIKPIEDEYELFSDTHCQYGLCRNEPYTVICANTETRQLVTIDVPRLYQQAVERLCHESSEEEESSGSESQ